MNLLLLTEDDRVAAGVDRFTIADHRHQHLRTVLKAEPGRTLRVGLWDADLGQGVVTATDDAHTQLEVTWTSPPPARPLVHLLLAIPRPKSLKKLLPEIVALGVGRLTLLRSWRVAQPYLSSPLLTADKQRPLILEGLMQAGCTRPPIVEVRTTFRPFVEDIAPRLPGTKLVLHPRGPHRFADQRPGAEPVVVALGPEGGWRDYEVDAFKKAGFRSVTLSDRVLRVETACVATLAQLEVLRQIRA